MRKGLILVLMGWVTPDGSTMVQEGAMDIPEDLRHLVDELGEALIRALAENDHCRALAQRIQAAGYDMALSLEATVISLDLAPGPEAAPPSAWSSEDQALLRTFRISLD